MTTTRTHNPDFPFVVHSPMSGDLAQFREFADANFYISKADSTRFLNWEVIDTTPKPQIPEDASFITWKNAGWINTAAYDGKNGKKPWAYDGILYSAEDLVSEEIGDAEITVLDVRK